MTRDASRKTAELNLRWRLTSDRPASILDARLKIEYHPFMASSGIAESSDGAQRCEGGERLPNGCRGQLLSDGFLLLLEASAALAANGRRGTHDWFGQNRATLHALLERFGALIMRGFEFEHADDFHILFEDWSPFAAGYAGGATPRERIAGNVFESTRAIREARIILHQEMAYLAHHPRRLAFCCVIPPSSGGQTTVADMRRVDERLPRTLRRSLRDRGVCYIRNFRDASGGSEESGYALRGYHRSWQEAFYTNDREAVERRCGDLGLGHIWLADGSLTVENRLAAFERHPATREEVWFNAIAALHPNRITLGPAYLLFERLYGPRSVRPYTVAWGDGTPIEFAEIQDVYGILDELTVSFDWRAGDLLLLDNVLAAHGRNPYRGRRDVRVMLFN